jgi:hypothetical protein
MKRLLTALACLAVLAFNAPDLRAQVRFGGQVSYGDDFDLGLGVRLVSSLRSMTRTPLAFHGSFDYFFPDYDVPGVDADYSYWEINPGIVYMIPVRGSGVAPYAGGGLNIAHLSADAAGESNSDTDLGLNLMGGIQFGTRSRMRPFVEGRLAISGGDQFVLTGGLLF